MSPSLALGSQCPERRSAKARTTHSPDRPWGEEWHRGCHGADAAVQTICLLTLNLHFLSRPDCHGEKPCQNAQQKGDCCGCQDTLRVV